MCLRYFFRRRALAQSAARPTAAPAAARGLGATQRVIRFRDDDVTRMLLQVTMHGEGNSSGVELGHA